MHNEQTYKKGSYLFLEGEEDYNNVYIIKTGKIHYKYNNDKFLKIKQSGGPGDIIGFISSLSKRPRMFSVITAEDSRIVKLPRDEFLSLVSKNIDIALKVLDTFSETLRNYNDLFVSRDFLQLEKNQRLFFSVGKNFYKWNYKPYALYTLQKYLDLYPRGEYTGEAGQIIARLKEEKIASKMGPFADGLEKKVVSDQVIFCEGEPGDELYIIKSGSVKILKNTDSSPAMLSLLREGDIFGEMAIISNKSRNATAVSSGETIVMAINKNVMKSLLEKSPELLKKIYVSVSKRLWFTMIRYEAHLYKNPLTRMYAFLENKLLEESVSLKQHAAHTFNFGIDELLTMTGLNQDSAKKFLDEFMSDKNLLFNFGQITIVHPCELTSTVMYYKSRDNVSVGGAKEQPEQKAQTGSRCKE